MDSEKAKFEKPCDCGKIFASKNAYFTHRRKCEHAKKECQPGNFKCKEQDCSSTFKYSADFITHLQSSHDLKIENETKEFEIYTEFEDWKDLYEKRTTSSFILDKVKKNSIGTVEYFYCNRSGCYASQSSGKRLQKSQGLSKIGSNCTASIKVERKDSSEKVAATITHTHYGHDQKLAHIPISKNDRKSIASQLNQGIESHRVLKNIFSGTESQLERQHLCTKRDILNIANAYGIEKIEKHAKDHLSVDAYFLEDLKKDKSIILYKRQEEETLVHPAEEICTLNSNDFALGIMTDFQRNMFLKFGKDIICLDATHGTNQYDFNLITVLVIDEFREGVPVAWLISNRETSVALTLFFKAIKNQIGNINPRIIMTDKAPQYFSSFVDVFDCEPKKLLCHWHVHHDWRKQLIKIRGKDTASVLYKGLCLLLEEPDTSKFETLLEKSLEKMDDNEDTRDFGQYFRKEWVPVKTEWAKCYRVRSGVNTNMYVESFHKTLKYGESYLRGKQGKRLDKCIVILQEFVKKLAINRLIKLEKGKHTWKSSEIAKRHRTALELPTSLVSQTSGCTWKVATQRSINADTTCLDRLFYKVKKHPECFENCQIRCRECNICLHSYSCNCPDALVGTNICKHIHLVVRNNVIEQTPLTDVVDKAERQEKSGNECSEVTESFASAQVEEDPLGANSLLKLLTQKNDKMHDLKSLLVTKIMTMCDKISKCNNMDALQTAKNHINSADAILELEILGTQERDSSEGQLKSKSTTPHNKNVDTQKRSFFSTKNNRNKTNVKYAKPSWEDKIDLENELLNDVIRNEVHNDHAYFSTITLQNTLDVVHETFDNNTIEAVALPSTSKTYENLHINSALSSKDNATSTNTSNDANKKSLNQCAPKNSRLSRRKLQTQPLPPIIRRFLLCFISREKVNGLLKENGKVKAMEQDVETQPENVPDQVVDLTLTQDSIQKIRTFVTDDAWLLVNQVLEMKRKSWLCDLCLKVSSKLNMVQCDTCQKWIHWKCANLNQEPESEAWHCKKCTRNNLTLKPL